MERSDDAAAFNSCDIIEILGNPRRYFPTDGYLVGDSAYPLSRHLIVPYPNSESLSNPYKRRFNRMLSASRVSIERTFGLLVDIYNCTDWSFGCRLFFIHFKHTTH
ncbi:MAG: hypothetical protein JSY10_24090 [Paenibacillus sp.]|nr:hypothetical protein [Paenibacillus sp.]